MVTGMSEKNKTKQKRVILDDDISLTCRLSLVKHSNKGPKESYRAQGNEGEREEILTGRSLHPSNPP